MIYDRLDGNCRAKVLAVSGDQLLIDARWKANSSDARKFLITHGIASNIVHVSKEYFAKKYGVQL